MNKTLNIGLGIEGQIRATVRLEFIPMIALGPDESRTPASKQLYMNDVNARLAAVARSIQNTLESQTIEELENRMPK